MIRLLALDVSSTAAGWAVLEASSETGRPEVVRGGIGVIRASKGWDDDRRIDHVVDRVVDLVHAFRPARIAMEWTDGKVAKYRPKVAGGERQAMVGASGLAIMGKAQGAVRQALRPMPMDLFGEKRWTKGKSKDDRSKVVRLQFPEYSRWAEGGLDKGLDAADALGIGLFAFGEICREALLASVGVGTEKGERRCNG